jgi:hypothetical protein
MSECCICYKNNIELHDIHNNSKHSEKICPMCYVKIDDCPICRTELNTLDKIMDYLAYIHDNMVLINLFFVNGQLICSMKTIITKLNNSNGILPISPILANLSMTDIDNALYFRTN